MCSDERQRELPQPDPKLVLFCTNQGSPAARLWYGPPVLGQAHTPRRRMLLVRRCRTRGAGCAWHGRRESVARPHASLRAAGRCDRCEIALGRARPLLARPKARRARIAARSAAQRGTPRCAAGGRACRHQLAIAKRSTRISQARVAQRLRLLYEQENVEPLEIVFGSKNLDEAITNLDNLNRVTGQGEDVLRELAGARRSIVDAARGLASQNARLALATQAAEATTASLARSAYGAQLVSRLARGAAQVDGTADRKSRCGGAGGAAAQRADRVDRNDTYERDDRPRLRAVRGSRTLTVSATGYALQGHTASGLPVGWGVVAVDPARDPARHANDHSRIRRSSCRRPGGSIVGATIDLWFPTVAQANAWGRRTVTIVLH